jgi:hypothetical protein
VNISDVGNLVENRVFKTRQVRWRAWEYFNDKARVVSFCQAFSLQSSLKEKATWGGNENKKTASGVNRRLPERLKTYEFFRNS